MEVRVGLWVWRWVHGGEGGKMSEKGGLSIVVREGVHVQRCVREKM